MKTEIELPPDVEALYAAEASAKAASLEQHIIDYLIATACLKDERSKAISAAWPAQLTSVARHHNRFVEASGHLR